MTLKLTQMTLKLEGDRDIPKIRDIPKMYPTTENEAAASLKHLNLSIN